MDHTLKDVILRIKLGFSFNARFDPSTNKIALQSERKSNIVTGNKTDSNKTDGDKKVRTEKDSNKTDGDKTDDNKTDGDKTDGDKKDKKPASLRKSSRLKEDDHESSDCLNERLKDPQTKTLTLKL